MGNPLWHVGKGRFNCNPSVMSFTKFLKHMNLSKSKEVVGISLKQLLLSCLSLAIITASSDLGLILCISTVGASMGFSYILLSRLSESFFFRARSNNLHVVFRSFWSEQTNLNLHGISKPPFSRLDEYRLVPVTLHVIIPERRNTEQMDDISARMWLTTWQWPWQIGHEHYQFLIGKTEFLLMERSIFLHKHDILWWKFQFQ